MPASSTLDLNAQPISPWAVDARGYVFIFTHTDCPIANRYAPALRRLFNRYQNDGVRFWLVYSESLGESDTDSIRAMAAHVAAFDLPIPALLDTQHDLVSAAGATMSPEAAVFDSRRRLIYRGRIDDRFPQYGVRRPVQREDLSRAIDDLLNGAFDESVNLNPRVTQAIGCYLSDLH